MILLFEKLWVSPSFLTIQLITFLITEADVHTAIPTIGNAAATWAGWAVSAVSAKFYRSQSDTRPRPPLTGKNLSKPASLGNKNFCALKSLM